MGRPAERMTRIVESLRGEIVSGHFPPGSRLPARLDVERRYEASSVTVQRALTQLAQEGFVRVDRTLGSYVTDAPPHLSHYTIVFPKSPHGVDPWNMWYATLLSASKIVAEQRGITIEPAFDIDSHIDTPSYIHLVDTIQSSRVAGLIFSVPPMALEGTPICEHPNLPRVVATSHEVYHSVSRADSPLLTAMNVLKESGRNRVAMFASARQDVSGFTRAAEECGLESRPYWVQRVDLASPDTARDIVQLLMSPENTVHPDAIYIDDDNLIDAVVAGLLGAGIRVPTDLEIVAHANLPVQTKSVVPIRRFGVDARKVIAGCIDCLERQRAGETDRIKIKVPMVFEEDLVSDDVASRRGAL